MTNLVFVFSLLPGTGSPAGLHEADEGSEGRREEGFCSLPISS